MKLILILAAAIIFSFNSTASAEGIIPKISVSGEGVVEVAPDRATISVGVVTRDKNAAKVQTENARIASEIIKSAVALGIDKKNIRTGNYSFYPNYRQENNRQVADGYEATNSVIVIVDDLNLVGKVIDAALSHGANKVDSLEFGIKDKNKLQNEAIRLAVRNARAKAEVVAAEIGKNIIGVLNVSVNSGYISAPRANKMFMADMAVGESVATPIESGMLNCSASVQVEFEISR